MLTYGRRITFADVVWTKKDGNPVDKPAGQEYLIDPEATALYGFSDGNYYPNCPREL